MKENMSFRKRVEQNDRLFETARACARVRERDCLRRGGLGRYTYVYVCVCVFVVLSVCVRVRELVRVLLCLCF